MDGLGFMKFDDRLERCSAVLPGVVLPGIVVARRVPEIDMEIVIVGARIVDPGDSQIELDFAYGNLSFLIKLLLDRVKAARKTPRSDFL